MKQFLKKLKVSFTVALSVMLCVFVVGGGVGAFDLQYNDFNFKNLTTEEFNKLELGGDFDLGAIVMQEGQKDAYQPFLPQNHEETDIGSYTQAFNDGYASGTLYIGKVVATSTDSTINGSKICTADGTNCALTTTNLFWTTSETNGPFYTSSTQYATGIGDATPDAAFDIDGGFNQTQLLVSGFLNQTADIFQVASSTEDVLFSIDTDGNVSASGTFAVIGASSLTGVLTMGGNITSDTNNTDSLGGAIGWADISSSGTLYATVANVDSTLTVDGASTLTGNSTVGGTFGVTGITTLTGALVANGNVDIGNAITDTVTITGYLDANLHSSSSLLLTGNATTSHIYPWANNTYDLGYYDNAWKNIYASGTLYGAAANFNGNVDIGDAVSDTLTITSVIDGGLFASSTLDVTGVVDFYATTTLYGAGADLIVGGMGTSTFAGNLTVNHGTGATTTVVIGDASSGAGYGSCLEMAGGEGTGMLYLYINSALQLATSTSQTVCY